jgi:hypothetical protein
MEQYRDLIFIVLTRSGGRPRIRLLDDCDDAHLSREGVADKHRRRVARGSQAAGAGRIGNGLSAAFLKPRDEG